MGNKTITENGRKAKSARTTPNIIAIGASAGGLEALQDFLSHLPPLPGTCIIVAQHLSPTHKSMLVQILSRETALSVAEAEHGKILEADKVYITPPDKEISISKGKIQLKKPTVSAGPKPSVDVLFQSLSEENSYKIIGVILSGTGSDGAIGVKSLRKNGAFLIAQDPDTAKYNGMPLASIQTGAIHAILSPEAMGEEIATYFSRARRAILIDHESEETSQALSQIMELLSKRTGTDFSNYKSATIARRLEKRMAMLHLQSIKEYLAVINKNPGEAEEMFNIILIGVTAFFRDPEAFSALETHMRTFIDGKDGQGTIRIWSPGCSTGEEAYSIAIMLHRLLRDQTHQYTIQIFATDIDERAIATARRGIYQESTLSGLPEEVIEQYFIPGEEGYEVQKSIRSMVLFTIHDVIRHPPFLKLDLICCRNLLIYFNAALQQQVLPVFHYALNPDGYLFLGKSETVGQFSDLFASTDTRHRIFQRKRGGNLNAIRFSAFKAQKIQIPKAQKESSKSLTLPDLVKETLFNSYEHPYVVIDEGYTIQEVNGDVRLFLSLSPGSMQANLLKMLNEELQIEVRALLTKVISERTSLKGNIKRFNLFGQEHFVRIAAKPLLYTGGTEELFIVIFEELEIEGFIAKDPSGTSEIATSARLQELEYELAATREQLQNYIEEIETSNEELQSLNEEMQSTNEELQSANEELETSNEELQSSNEEIQIAYTELKAAHEELEHKKMLLKTLQANTEALLNNDLQALVMVDRSYKILQYNTKAVEDCKQLSGKIIKEGASFIDLLPEGQVEPFVQDFKKAISGKVYKGEREFTNIQGEKRWFSLNYSPVVYDQGEVSGISIGMLDVTDLRVALSELNASERLVNTVFNTVSTGICITDEHGIFVDVNKKYCDIYGYSKEELIGQRFTMVVSEKHREMLQKLHDDFINKGTEPPSEFPVVTKSGKLITVSAVADMLVHPDGERFKVTSVQDISMLKEVESELSLLMNNTEECFILMDKNLEILTFNKQFRLLHKEYFGVEVQVGESILKYAQPERKKLLKGVYERVLKGEKEETEISLPVKGKGTFTFSIKYKPARNQEGEIIGAFVATADITKQKIAADQLVISEKRYRALVENGADSLAIIGPDGIPTYVSPSIEKVLGYTEEEALNANLFSLIHPDDLPGITAKMQEVLANPGVPVPGITSRTLHKNGSWRWMEATITNLLHDPVIQGIVDNFRDVTDKVEAEAQIRQSESYLLEAQRLAKMGSWNFDFDKDQLTWTEALYDVFGVDRKTFNETHGSFVELVDPEYKDLVRETSKQAQLTGKAFSIEYRITTPGGEKRIIEEYGYGEKDEKGQVVRLFGTAQDITERKRIEEQIRLSNERFEKIAEATNDAVWDYDYEKDTLFWGRGFYELFGYDPEKVTPTFDLLMSLVHPEDRERIVGQVRLFIKTPQGRNWFEEYRFLKADGSYAYVIDRAIFIRDHRDKVTRVIGAMTDISYRKEYEDSLRKLNENLERQAKELAFSNSELEQFAYVASHDLQEPLRMVTSFLTQLESRYGGKLDDKAHKYIHFAVDGATRMRQIILDLLEFSRAGRHSDELETLNLNDLVAEVCQLQGTFIAEKEASIKYSKLPKIRSYRTPLMRVFQNLISNALKYARRDVKPEIKITSRQEGDLWEFAISDNGIGMEQSDLEKIFIIFQRLHHKDEYGGTGLGLAVVRKVIEQLGGRIWVKSVPGKGSTFYFTLRK